MSKVWSPQKTATRQITHGPGEEDSSQPNDVGDGINQLYTQSYNSNRPLCYVIVRVGCSPSLPLPLSLSLSVNELRSTLVNRSWEQFNPIETDSNNQLTPTRMQCISY